MIFSLTGFQWPPFITGLLAMVVVLIFGLVAVRNVSTAVPSGAQNVLESAVETFQDLVGQMAPKELAPNLTLLSLTLFLLLVVANVLGLLPLPGVGTRWIHSPTAFLSMPAGLAIAIFLLIQWSGIKYKGLGGFLVGWFWKPIPVFGVVVNALEQLVMPVSLAFRLFGNILAGELVLRMTTNVPHAPAGWLVVILVGTLWLVFSLVISLIQALIFTILTVAYMSIQASTDH
ncbi:MAG: F0F1 ATP synthase subunit A [Firmicutes bacterium]|jgi:F-type H+-transporting ATPase subunit a|uniref:ATP synthase subunit a n=1 Tax=Sulfobacillus benefaciens TaxID=453960 RepID=A0A2T2WSS4_9FIRM|nr:F0F1 ATP synthase subunit A [Bacillota bacterium]MCL5015500.1 F0F1 ATP synthase subunit A [Bacillota bacterium]PSR25243.1 MAG: ATP synthase F0 subunit A [Sulfobacillus benefaciens]HBQ94828.1 ATP synthase F0 subunit A [Sulfobacillus sp.]